MENYLNNLATQIHQNNKEKGFYDEPKNTGEMIALMHSELSEALEADRKGVKCIPPMNDLDLLDDNNFEISYKHEVKGAFEEEMADILIRVLDMCAYKGIDIDFHVEAKMRYNKLRPHKHGKKY